LRSVVRKGRAPIRHDGIANIFVDDPLMIADWPRHRREVAIHDLHKTLRSHPLAGAGKSPDVAEQHGHDAPLPFRRQHRPVDQSFDDARIDVLSKGLANALLETQLLHHLIEGSGQMSDFVFRRNGHLSIQVAGLHGLGAFE